MLRKSDQLCRFYSRGKQCKFGDTCHFLHEESDPLCDNTTANPPKTTEESRETPVKESSEELFSKNSETREENEGINSRGKASELAISSTFVTSGKSKQRICSYFSKHKRCAFGRNCRFIHEITDHEDVVKRPDSVSTNPEFQPADNNDRHDSLKEEPEAQETDFQKKTQNDKIAGGKICNYYAWNGHCPYQYRCRFKHVRDYARPPRFEAKYAEDMAVPKCDQEEQEDPNSLKPVQKESKTKAQQHNKSKEIKRKLCRYFRNGHCKAGSKCRFWHPVDVMDDLTTEFDESVEINQSKSEAQDNATDAGKAASGHQAKRSYPNRAPVRTPNTKISLKRDTATLDDLEKLRRTEVDQLVKRFPRDRCSVLKDDSDGFECRVVFSPSDPDWPFDVKRFELLFSIPASYPEEMMTITLPVDQDLPETVRRYQELCVADWVIEKGDQLEEAGVYEIVFRPFLRWLDRSLETNVTEGLRQMKRELVAKAAGFEFIKASELQSKYKTAEEETSDEGMEDEADEEEGEDNSEEEEEDDDEQSNNVPLDVDTEKKGTEVTLRQLQLREGASTLRFEKIHIIIQCTRCKNRSDFKTTPKRINSISCSKCNGTQLVTFRPVLTHQFSSIMGYLDLENCTAFDLVLQESAATVGCINCSKESKIDGISPGQPLNSWCRHCHQKMMIAVESVRFAQLQPSGIETDPKAVHQVATKRRVLKDPAIQEGKPLPEYGACKHYKKSYRWFRFPCCGMVYPCDVCHDERGDGHEMVFANRVICGFCCKEQPYSPDKPCVGCKQMLTRSKSSHWEGGLGCRSKVKMSKNDSQKYSNMNKTVSKHAQKLKESNSKKRTKLRHA